MRTIRTKVYKFDELTPEGKKKALEVLYDINVEGFKWYDYTVEEQEEDLINEGFEDAEISFSGFSSQGDGACFDAKINVSKFCSDPRILRIAEESNFFIAKNSYSNHYSHERTRYVDDERPTSKRHTRINKALDDLSELIESKRMELSKKIYRTLEAEYEYRTSEEAILETIEANDYEFYANDKLL